MGRKHRFPAEDAGGAPVLTVSIRQLVRQRQTKTVGAMFVAQTKLQWLVCSYCFIYRFIIKSWSHGALEDTLASQQPPQTEFDFWFGYLLPVFGPGTWQWPGWREVPGWSSTVCRPRGCQVRKCLRKHNSIFCYVLNVGFGRVII